jgi:hypothetical protein
MAARSGSDPDEVARRAEVFRARLAEHRVRGRVGAPVLTLLDDPPRGELPPARPGRCVSCDAVLEPDRAWRCSTCLRAIAMALDEGLDAHYR